MKSQSYFDDCIQKFGFCFIAEISNNHLVDFDRYLKLIDVAANQGAHATEDCRITQGQQQATRTG